MSAPLSGVARNPWGSRRLWSLWDMLSFNASVFSDMIGVLNRAVALIGERKTQIDNPVTAADIRNGRKLCETLERDLATLGAKVTHAGVSRLKKRLVKKKINPIKNKEFGETLNELNDRLYDELSLIQLFVLDGEKSKYFSPPSGLFGSEFSTKFPSGGFEVEEAGKCLALSRDTAALFHLMRVMEIGIRAVARCLSILDPTEPRERNWGDILRKIKDEMSDKSAKKLWKNAKDKEFFESAYVSLDAVRVAWRNPTMHVENKYTPDEAEHVFIAVRGFMKNLSSRLDEDGQPIA